MKRRSIKFALLRAALTRRESTVLALLRAPKVRRDSTIYLALLRALRAKRELRVLASLPAAPIRRESMASVLPPALRARPGVRMALALAQRARRLKPPPSASLSVPRVRREMTLVSAPRKRVPLLSPLSLLPPSLPSPPSCTE